MMTIVIGVFKIIGWTLLGAAGFLLLLLLLLLFFPIRYEVRGNVRESYAAKARLWWLFHLLHASCALQSGQGFTYGVRALGIRVLGRKKKKEEAPADALSGENKEQAAEFLTQSKKEAAFLEVNVKKSEEKKAASAVREKEENRALKKAEKALKQKEKAAQKKAAKEGNAGKAVTPLYHRFCAVLDKVSAVHEKVRGAAEKKLNQAEGLDFLLHSRLFSEAFSEGKEQLFRILKKLYPKKIKGEVLFGMEDPAATGEAFALMQTALLPLPGAEKLLLKPDFAQKTMDATLVLKGHFMLISLAIPALKLYKNKKIHTVIKKGRRIIHG